MTINRHQNHRLWIYTEWTAVGRFTLYRNPTLRRTPLSITLSQDGPWWSIWGRQEGILGMMTICISHRGEFLLLFSIQIALLFILLSYWQLICKLLTSTGWDTWQQVTIPISFFVTRLYMASPSNHMQTSYPSVEMTLDLVSYLSLV